MVKKSKPKSTGKKKSTAKKKAGPKKPAVTSGAVKKGAAKSKVKARPKKGKISTKNLLLKKFDTSATAVYKPKATALKIPDSPPFVTGLSAKETKRVKALLLKAFDLKAAPAKKKAAPAKKATAKPKTKAKPKAKKPAEPKKAKVSVKDLLLKKFDTSAAAAKDLYTPEAATSEIPDSPPFVTGYDADETKRIRALLLKRFDLKAEPAIEETPEPGAKEIERPTAPMPLPSVSGEGSGSVAKAMVLGLCGLAVLIAFVIGASFSNRDKFYLKEAHGAVQVWQGKFAPVGTEMVMSLDGMKLPTPVQDVYSEEEAYGMVYNHFLGKADALMNQPGWPDFRKVNAYLHQAAVHAPSAESRAKVQTRINGLNFLVLLHRSDVALARGTMADLEAAQEHLKKADAYASIGYQQELVERRRVAVERALAALATK
jgi:histone H1/5